jgi:hypothetical protein
VIERDRRPGASLSTFLDRDQAAGRRRFDGKNHARECPLIQINDNFRRAQDIEKYGRRTAPERLA